MEQHDEAINRLERAKEVCSGSEHYHLDLNPSSSYLQVMFRRWPSTGRTGWKSRTIVSATFLGGGVWSHLQPKFCGHAFMRQEQKQSAVSVHINVN